MADRLPDEGTQTPDFTLTAGVGRTVTLSADLRDHHAVLYLVREYS